MSRIKRVNRLTDRRNETGNTAKLIAVAIIVFVIPNALILISIL